MLYACGDAFDRRDITNTGFVRMFISRSWVFPLKKRRTELQPSHVPVPSVVLVYQ
jgi:hypothetical protein